MQPPAVHILAHYLTAFVVLALTLRALLGPALILPRSEWPSALPRMWTRLVQTHCLPSTQCLSPPSALSTILSVLTGTQPTDDELADLVFQLDADGDGALSRCELWSGQTDCPVRTGIVEYLDAKRRTFYVKRSGWAPPFPTRPVE